MDLTRFNDLRAAMNLAGIKPKKGLGQHFLIDQVALGQIVGAAEISYRDTVLEIGPGLGVMTAVLAEQADKVIAVETDSVMAELLRRDIPANLEVVEQDILDFNLAQLPSNYKVVANLPYYLTSKIFRLLLESPNPPVVMSILVQREVAHRITAGPGQYSVLALSVQYYAHPQIIGTVERHKFWPAPKVDSAILKITRRNQPAFPADTSKLFRLIKAGFGERRKQLKNSLAGGLNCSQEIMMAVLKKARLSPTARAQELSLAEWERLYKQAARAKLL
jgi:16S rRNA (adenine1518-N6/adenine1519-N6)-dimethyltransferase